jgi:hypothetical protein
MRRQVIGDLLEVGQLPARVGGLRGGHAAVTPGGLILLEKVVYVPGVEVSGDVPLDAAATQILRVGGPKAARGSLTITPSSITGRLGGRRVNLVARSAGLRTFGGTALDRLVKRFRLRHSG